MIFIDYFNILIIMVDIKFIRKPFKKGDHIDDYAFKIPRVYIRNDLINPDITYEVKVCPIKKSKPNT